MGQFRWQKGNWTLMTFKDRLSGATKRAKDALRTRQGSIERGIDKAGDFASQKAGARHDQRIRRVSRHLRTGLAKVTGNPSAPDTSPGAAPEGYYQPPAEPGVDRPHAPGKNEDGKNGRDRP